MNFGNRIKKEMSEGIVKAILEDAGYRVIDTGIERVIREICCLDAVEYRQLGYPEAMNRAPDFTVMNRAQNEKFLVEVKYRAVWGREVFEQVREQVRLFGEMVLISINGSADDPYDYNSPSRFIRCCTLKFEDSIYKIEVRQKDGQRSRAWRPVDELVDGSALWWQMMPLPEKFTRLNDDKEKATLFSAVQALAGILEL